MLLINSDECIVEKFENFVVKGKQLMSVLEKMPFTTKKIKMMGKLIDTPRQTCSVHFNRDNEDINQSYTYSGIKEIPMLAPDELFQLKEEVETKTGAKFNYALLNLYRNEKDSVEYHADNEDIIVSDSTIASISIGGARKFNMKNIKTKELKSVLLSHGSLLVMKGKTQSKWNHGIPKSKRKMSKRINITFRLNHQSN